MAIAGLAAGLVIILLTDAPQAIGEMLFAGSLAAIILSYLKKWVTDTSFEKERLRLATTTGESAARQAQVGHALQLAERERDRRLAEENRQEAERRVRVAEDRADQAEINSSMRAHAYEQSCETRLAEGIAAAEARADERIAAARRELADERTTLMLDQYMAGVRDERSGHVDDILRGIEHSKVIQLDDRRPRGLHSNAAGLPQPPRTAETPPR